jgi:hypothetical protein
MGTVGIWITDPLDDCEVAVIVNAFEQRETRIQAYERIERQNLVLRNCELRARLEIKIILKGNDRVQTVVAAGQLDNKKDRMILSSHCLQRGIGGLRVERHEGALDKHRYRPTESGT